MVCPTSLVSHRMGATSAGNVRFVAKTLSIELENCGLTFNWMFNGCFKTIYVAEFRFIK